MKVKVLQKNVDTGDARMQYREVKACGKQSMCVVLTPTTPSCNISLVLQCLPYDIIKTALNVDNVCVFTCFFFVDYIETIHPVHLTRA